MCLLGVSMMNNHIYGSKVPQNPHFGGLNRHFKPNMQKIQIAISSDLCIRLTWNMIGSCGQQQRLRGWSRMVVKQFQDGGWPPFWKSIYHYISAKNRPISMKCCTQQQIFNWMNVTWSKMRKLHWTDSEFDRTYFLVTYKLLFFIILHEFDGDGKICQCSSQDQAQGKNLASRPRPGLKDYISNWTTRINK